LEIFVPSLDRPFVLGSTEGTFNLWHLYQTSPNGGWSYWKDLGAPRPGVVGVWGGPAVGSAADGRLEVFVRGSDGHLWYRYQTPPRHLSSGYQTFGDWSDWEDLGVPQLGAVVACDPGVGWGKLPTPLRPREPPPPEQPL